MNVVQKRLRNGLGASAGDLAQLFWWERRRAAMYNSSRLQLVAMVRTDGAPLTRKATPWDTILSIVAGRSANESPDNNVRPISEGLWRHRRHNDTLFERLQSMSSRTVDLI